MLLISDHQVSSLQVFVYRPPGGLQATLEQVGRLAAGNPQYMLFLHGYLGMLKQVFSPTACRYYHHRHGPRTTSCPRHSTRTLFSCSDWLPERCFCAIPTYPSTYIHGTVHSTHYGAVAVCRPPPQLGHGGDSMLIIEAPHWYMTTASAGCG